MMGLPGFLGACQTGHPFSSQYQNGYPVSRMARNTPRPIPVPRDKPRPPAAAPVTKTTATAARTQAPSPPPDGAMMKVRKGDTIYALSRRHDVTVRGIIQVNNLEPPYLLYPGQKLKSPATGVHVVKKGDTIYSLSRNYRVDMTNFARLNDLRKPYRLAIGQKLKVPAGVHTGKPALHQAALPLPAPRSGKGFMWPVEGPVLSSFGAKDKGYHNDGINIAAKPGSYVRAAESGVVVHAGQKIRGFGQLVLIRHDGGWITAYAHNSSILVTKEQAVKRGQAIARVGQTGGVKRPQLHFEMRKGARAVNPVSYLVR